MASVFFSILNDNEYFQLPGSQNKNFFKLKKDYNLFRILPPIISVRKADHLKQEKYNDIN